MQAIKLINVPIAGECAHIVGELAAIFTFLGWLEEKDEVIFWLMFSKITEDAEGDSHVDIMSASVRDAGMLRGKWQSGFFGNRQRVDIGPIANRTLRIAPLDLDE